MKKKGFDAYVNGSSAYKKSSTKSMLGELARKKSAYWGVRGEQSALALFRLASKEVPAYKKFLKENNVAANRVRTISDFKTLPAMTKQNYLRAHPLADLCIDGSLNEKGIVFTATSGSTGKPFYFPRDHVIDLQSSIVHETILRNMQIDFKKPTLVVVGFGMGVWIGGMITYEAFKTMTERGLPLSIITPGPRKADMLEIVRDLGPMYEQIILCGYPPFIKDIIDEGESAGIDWQKFGAVKLLCAAETFSEDFRDYLAEKIGGNAICDIADIYGSADIGTMAFETPLSILVRRLSLQHPNLFAKLFPELNRLPSLAQFHPEFLLVEEQNRQLLLTGYNALPLLRYDIGDTGGVLSYADIEKICAAEGIDLKREAKKVGILDTVSELPFVYIYERSDFSTKLYGAIIYPEYVRAGLAAKELQKFVTGKFTMFTKHDESQDEYLELNIELKKNVTPTEELRHSATKAISESLSAQSAEHKNNVNMMGAKVEPRIVFWHHEHPTFFAPGGKQKWVKKV